MHIIGMDQSTGNKTIVLMTLGNSGGPEDEIIQNFCIVESHYGSNTG